MHVDVGLFCVFPVLSEDIIPLRVSGVSVGGDLKWERTPLATSRPGV